MKILSRSVWIAVLAVMAITFTATPTAFDTQNTQSQDARRVKSKRKYIVQTIVTGTQSKTYAAK